MNDHAPRSRASRPFAALLGAWILVGVVGFAASTSRAEDVASDEARRPEVSPIELSKAVDRLIDARLEAEGVDPAPRSNDSEFLRRVYLDLVGTVPTVEEVHAFLKDGARDKRARKIDELLASEAFAEHWGVVWFKTTTGISPAARLGRGGEGARYIRGKSGEMYLAWLQDQMAAERPYDQWVQDILTADGRTDENGAAGFLARWSEDTNNLASATSKVFLGTRIQCAQCHDHIYEEDWKQKDFQGMAAFFATTTFQRPPEYREFRQLREQMQRNAEAKRDGKAEELGDAGDGMMDGADGDGMDAPEAPDAKRRGKRQARKPDYDLEAMTPAERREALARLRQSASTLVISESPLDSRQAERIQRRFEQAKNPENPQAEKFKERLALMTTTPKFWMAGQAADVPGIPRRMLLARWITSPENELFSKTLVNRYWGHFLGSGFVQPVDDFTSVNTPSHPEILDLLAGDFVTSGYDLKRVVRIIANTEAYQRTSRWTGDEEPDAQLFAKAPVRPLDTEQLYHALVRATGMEARLDRGSRRAAQQVQQAIFSVFSFVFDDDEGTEEQDFEGSIPQGLFLMNGQLMQRAIEAGRGSLLDRVMRQDKRHGERVEQLYLAAFGRAPVADETNGAVRFLESQGGTPKAYEDLWWALLNSAEFMTNH